MPLYFQIVEDTLKNIERFDIATALKNLKIPLLIVHGTKDETVSIDEAQKINEWNSTSELFIIEGSGHSFGASHPYNETSFPLHVQLLLDKTLAFLKK
jgi:pimeloyl-ACP methyl ester carboxylesterase